MEKKNLAIILLAVVLAASGIGNIILAINARIIQDTKEQKELLKVAVTSNPLTLDPVDTMDRVSNDILNQVVETLIFYNYPSKSFLPCLAEEWTWVSLTELNFKLREHVFFHDGYRFNATAVKFSFDRINYFGNTSGTLPTVQLEAHPSYLYKIDQTTPLIKNVTIYSEYNCSIFLNKAFTPFIGLLCYIASSIISPLSHSATDMINMSSELPIGTGPFKMISYSPNSEIKMARWERYWSTGAYFDEVVNLFYADVVEANYAMLAFDIDYLGPCMASLKPAFIDDPHIDVIETVTSSLYWYIGFNTSRVNLTWRKAIHFAFNYTYFLQDIEEDIGIKANSLVPPGFPGRNESVVAGYFDIPKARQILIDAGIAPASWTTGSQTGDDFTPGFHETEWKTANFTTLKFYTRVGSTFHQHVLAQLANEMASIGIIIEEIRQILDWMRPIIFDIYLDISRPKYFETFQMIQSLVDPLSDAIHPRVSITEINDYLTLASEETNTTKREDYYRYLQYLIHDKYYCIMPLEYEKVCFVHAKSLRGFPYNTNLDVNWYPTYRVN